ncbi:MAG: hypothetical protein LQ350_005843 [Teloschistes chrysophthalmus]|nr:MAG: hypothetical protein LQ350_005843 [Niorma chrysophthalma]
MDAKTNTTPITHADLHAFSQHLAGKFEELRRHMDDEVHHIRRCMTNTPTHGVLVMLGQVLREINDGYVARQQRLGEMQEEVKALKLQVALLSVKAAAAASAAATTTPPAEMATNSPSTAPPTNAPMRLETDVAAFLAAALGRK